MAQDSVEPKLDAQFQQFTAKIDRELDRFLPNPTQHLSQIQEAMRYSVLNGGKRIRPLLCLAVSEMLGGREEEAIVPACAVEMVHSYSLIHDDLPCLDNDEFRRGVLTSHKKYGEAIALLAGDALLTLSFEVLSKLADSKKVHRLVAEFSKAAGIAGMVGGQVMELAIDPKELDIPTLEAIHINKTGQLIKASCLAGAITAGASEQAESHILKFGEYLGFAFQIIDDILDGDGYLRFMSVHEAKDKASEVIEKGKKELVGFKNNQKLLQLAAFVLSRSATES